MIIERTDLSGGACNFCKRGKINDDGNGIVYPYTEVTHISSDGSGASVRFCDECLNEVKEI